MRNLVKLLLLKKKVILRLVKRKYLNVSNLNPSPNLNLDLEADLIKTINLDLIQELTKTSQTFNFIMKTIPKFKKLYQKKIQGETKLKKKATRK
jgi:hypothetical protein